MTLKERAAKLKTDVTAVFLALRRTETPWTAKLVAAVTVAYALSPIDLIPDFIPVLGFWTISSSCPRSSRSPCGSCRGT